MKVEESREIDPVGLRPPRNAGAWAESGCGTWAQMLVVILAGAAYVGTLGYEFVWDDLATIVNTRTMRQLANLPAFFTTDLTALTEGAIPGKYYRPILAVSLAVDATLWGPTPAPFHLTNVLLHMAATLVVSRLALALGAGRTAAILTSLCFALHPVHAEVVVFVTQRFDMILAMAISGAVIAYRHSLEPDRRYLPWRLAALGAQLLALLCKEVAVSLPILLLAVDRLGHPVPARGSADATWRAAWARSVPFWWLSAAFVALRLPTLVHVVGDRPGGWHPWERLPGVFETLARFLWISLAPVHMQPLYDLPRPMSFFSLWPALGLLICAGLIGLLCWWWRRAPLAAFGLIWFLVTLLPVLDFVPLSFRNMGIADRYLYTPSIGFCLLLGLGLSRLLETCPGRWQRLRHVVGWACLFLVLVAYPILLLRYLPAWKNDPILYAHMEAVAPRASLPLLNTGLAALAVGDLRHATAAMERAVHLEPLWPLPRLHLAWLYILQGKPEAGFAMLDAVAPALGQDPAYYVTRAKAHLFVGQPAAALEHAEAGLRRIPGQLELLQWRGRALTGVGRRTEAIQAFRDALRIDPELYLIHEALAALLVQEGQIPDALAHYLRSVEIQPDRVLPVRALAILTEAQGNRQASRRLWRQVLDLAPHGQTLHEALAALGRLGGGDVPLSPSRP